MSSANKTFDGSPDWYSIVTAGMDRERAEKATILTPRDGRSAFHEATWKDSNGVPYGDDSMQSAEPTREISEPTDIWTSVLGFPL